MKPRNKQKTKKMRTQFVEVGTRKKAKSICPWAAKIAKVTFGFKCFESVSDYQIWKNQK